MNKLSQMNDPKLAANYDPPPDQREWYRSAQMGQRGYLVRENGVTYVRLDRNSEKLLRHFRTSEWVPELQDQPLTDLQRAEVCFNADRALCKALNLHDLARKEWLALTDGQKQEWIELGPQGDKHRRQMYALLQMYLKKVAR
jgi:hypothetical protein